MDTAKGKLWTADGRALTDVYGAGRGPATGGAGLKAPWNSPDSTMTWHVEGHAAAIMRRGKIKDATLYLNTHPCMKPNGCHGSISDVLPAGSTLTIFYQKGRSSVGIRVYEGNGKGLESRGQ